MKKHRSCIECGMTTGSRLRKFFLMMVSVVFIVGLFSADVSAQEEDKSDLDPYVDGGLSIGKCIAKGNLDFGLFLNSIIYADGFLEGIIEPWKDILWRNQCHSFDVLGLIKQRDKIRKYIRDAFLTCKTEKLPALRKAFFKLSAEIYYVRHVVDGGVIVSLPYNVIILDPDACLYPTAKLRSEMSEKYIKEEMLTQGEFDMLFAELEFKYTDRKYTYINKCENDSWEQVVEKWEEFIDTAGGITPALEKAEKGIVGRAEKIDKIVEDITDGGLKALFANRLQMNLNNMDMKAGFEEIAENIDDYMPVAPGSIPTQSTLLKAIEVADRKFETDKMRKEMSSNFASLYKDTSDSAVELLVTELDKFNTTILGSFKPLDKILECTKTMNKRQCPGKF